LVGQNPPPGAVIYYYLKDVPKGEVTIEILDPTGHLLRMYSSTKTEELDETPDPDDKKPGKQINPEAGLNRFVWDMRYEGARRVPDYHLWEYNNGRLGPLALPGRYQVRLTVDGKSQTAPLEVKLDLRLTVDKAGLQKQFDLRVQIRDELSRVYDAVNQIQDVRAQLGGLQKRLPENKPVVTAASDLDKKLLAVRDNLAQMQISANEDSLRYPQRVDSKLAYLGMAVGDGSDSAPTEADYKEFDKLKKQVDDFLALWAELQKTGLASFQKLVAEEHVQGIVVMPKPGI
jgi:hypothetical protein